VKWFVSRRKYDDLYARYQLALDATTKAREERDTAVYNRQQIARQLAEADAANRRLAGRNVELGVRLSAYAESDPEYLTALEKRLDRALKACARWMDIAWTEGRRADRLQTRLDDAVGLKPCRIEDSSRWQPGYQKPKEDAAS
jgi:hypothetical protein